MLSFKIKSLCLLSLSFLSAPAALAQSAQANDPVSIYVETGINKEQEGKIRARVNEFRTLTLSEGEVMVRLMKEMRDLSLQPDLNKSALDAKQTEINSLNNKMAMERNKMLVDLREFLNSEQRKKLVQLMQEPQKASVR